MDVEIGKQLKLGDLRVNTVVCLRAKHRPKIAITAWVRTIDETVCSFKMGEIFAVLYLYTDKEGNFFDGMRNVVEVYEYLGEI